MLDYKKLQRNTLPPAMKLRTVLCFSSLISLFFAAALGSTAIWAQAIDPTLLESLTPEERTELLKRFTQSSSTDDTGSERAAPESERNSPSRPDPAAGARDKDLRPEPFGYDIFSRPAGGFAPLRDIPAPTDYVLGPGDTLKVQLFGKENRNVTLNVSRSGEVTFPQLGPMVLAGLRFDDARSLIEKRVAREMLGVQVNVTLGQLRSIQIFVLGDVIRPGAYTVNALSTITNALFSSGGISKVGSLRKVQLKRGGQLIRQLDLYDLLLSGDSSADTRLQAGDVVFIPPVGPQVTLSGEIKRPAIYELKGDLSFEQAIEMAGGLSAASEATTAQVLRIEAGGQRRMQPLLLANADEIKQPVKDGDVITIRRIADTAAGQVVIEGPVKYPGPYSMQRVADLRSLIQQAQIDQLAPAEQPYLLIGLIVRASPRTGARSYRPFTVYQVLRESEPAVSLEDGDRVLLFSRSDIGFLQSAFVREALRGDREVLTQCRSLGELARFSGSQRAARLLQAFASEQAPVDLDIDEAEILARKSLKGVRMQDTKDLAQGSAKGRDRQLEELSSATAKAELAAAKAEAALVRFEEVSGAAEKNGNKLVDKNKGKGKDTERDKGKESLCPKIFEESPGVLSFLLDQSIGVFGEVQRQGLYPVARSTDINSVIESAGGLNREANTQAIEYLSYRLALEKGVPAYQGLDLTKPGALDRLLEPGDTLNVRARYTGQEVGAVMLAGEFKLPGRYTILRGETLSQLLARAGGLTEFAYPFGAVLARESAKRIEAQSLKRSAVELQDALVTTITSGALGGGSASATDFLKLLIAQIENATPLGRVVVEADPALISARPSLDIRLEPGDELFIPKRPNSVTVAGQVLSAGSVAFAPGASARDYIESSGGFTDYANKDQTFVVYPNGQAKRLSLSFWNFRDETVPPGSYIVVPRETPPVYSLFLTEKIAAIFSNLAVSAAALQTITRQ